VDAGTPSLAELLLAATAEPAATAARTAEVAEALDRVLSAARRAWPSITLASEPFVRHLALHLAGAEDCLLALERLRTGDLFLACACLQGDAEALRALDRQVLADVPGAIRRIDGSAALADEVRQLLAQRLLLGKDGERPRLITYSGRGPLTAWAAIAAQRIALDLVKKNRAEVPLEEDILAVFSSAGGPEADLVKQKYRGLLQEGLRRGLAGLSPRERTVLRLNLVGGVSLERIGKTYGVNPSTVSRWVTHARELILEAMQAHLQSEIEPDEFASIVRMVRSQVDIAMSASEVWGAPGPT
jgi:RNA polymerase sigma-70 factor, ECF subfamily